jgi:hypothetical protein
MAMKTRGIIWFYLYIAKCSDMHISNIITNLLLLVPVFFYILLLIMLKILLSLLELIFILDACTQKPGKVQSITNTLDTKPVPEIAKTDSDVHVQQQTGETITPLPFGPKAGPKKLFGKGAWSYYIEMIGEGYTSGNGFKTLKPVYPLPPIKKYRYTIVDTVYDPRDCGMRIPLDSMFRPGSYQLRLPDHEGFEVYYSADAAGINEANKNLAPGFNGRCPNFELHYYGLLIFYQRTTKTARLLPVYYSYYGESDHKRHFYIDKDYRIMLGNKIYSEGDYESKNPVDIMNGGRYEVMMKKTGEFTIKKSGE